MSWQYELGVSELGVKVYPPFPSKRDPLHFGLFIEFLLTIEFLISRVTAGHDHRFFLLPFLVPDSFSMSLVKIGNSARNVIRLQGLAVAQ